MADGNVQDIFWGLTGSHPPLGAYGWRRGQLAAGWRAFLICGAEKEGAGVTQQVGGSLCVGRLSARMPASLFL